MRRTRAVPLITVAMLLASATACGGGGSEGACGPVLREALDSQYLVHVIDVGAPVEYTSDPPTSGPHQPSPPVEGMVDEPIPRPVQVGILERGDVLVQYRPDLGDAAVDELSDLGTPGVVIAPNPELPEPIVATAWVHKRSCQELDRDALQDFIDERAGKGPEH